MLSTVMARLRELVLSPVMTRSRKMALSLSCAHSLVLVLYRAMARYRVKVLSIQVTHSGRFVRNKRPYFLQPLADSLSVISAL